MKPEPRIQKLADAMEAVLGQGIYLSKETAHFMESTCGILQPADLTRALSQPLNFEAESICEMIFYPDKIQQERLEPAVQECGALSPEERDMVEEMLAARSIEAGIFFPDIDIPASIPIPGGAAARFVRRLGLDRQIDPGILSAVHERAGSQRRAAALAVRLRNARFAFTENRRLSIEAFLTRMDGDDPEFMDLFDMLCRVLDAMDDREDLYDALMDRKRRCVEMIQMAEKNRKDLEKQPVEALMMRGMSIAAVNEEETKHEMHQIDRIALCLYGQTEHAAMMTGETPPAIHTGVYKKDEDDLERVIRILS